MAGSTTVSKTKATQKQTGTMKWLDTQSIGYILSDNHLIPEVYVTPFSLSSNSVKEGDRVKFNIKINVSDLQHSPEAIDISPFGKKCSSCKRFGHSSLKCPVSMNSRVKCFRCGLIGHYAKNCDQKFQGWSLNQTHTRSRSYSRRFNGWSSLFDGGDESRIVGVGMGPGLNSMVCVKKRGDVKRVEEVEDCFILEFDDDEDDDDVKCIICVKKVQDVKKVEEVEDCFILEFDPTELDNFSNLSVCEKSEGVVADDEVLILDEKGKVACRDYPHPRHLCATHPFKKTPHNLHCKMCYCNICDIPAPCKKWNESSKCSGLSHCDATESESVLEDLDKRHIQEVLGR
ncbi:uncharacterized protein [Spinacia oleracea]|uniref:CCHC-type domain-containing protein n=1 Tax=Spinacia oleracea TaxID=3562 RepID=A0A9R0J024_SPIOL|nr:uncharacterized protein LOC110796648 [Spinacia oleracea]